LDCELIFNQKESVKMRNRKKITYLGFILFLYGIISMNSCVEDFNLGDSFLEKEPGVEDNIDSVFTKAEKARSYLWTAYNSMYFGFNVVTTMNGNMFETLGDCTHSILDWDYVTGVYYTGNYSAGYEGSGGKNDWVRARFSYSNSIVWEGVRAGWIFIENIDRVPDMSDSEKERLKAEAKIIIATRYFDLLRHFGGLPIVERSYSASDDFTNPRATIEETINFVVKLCDEAAATPELPWNIPDNELENWEGRLTRGSAMGLKCKVLLFAASPLFNDAQAYSNEPPQDAVSNNHIWYGGYKAELWEQCKKACEDFFAENSKNGEYYKLVQPEQATEDAYRLAFRKGYRSRGNSEKLITTRKRYIQTAWSHGGIETDNQVISNTSHSGAFAPTLEFMEMFANADGSNFNTDNIYNTDNPANRDIFEKRDPRLYETILVQKKGESWNNNNVELWKGGVSITSAAPFFAHGLGLYKWVLDIHVNISNEPLQWPYLRMGELHLIYAEALAETGNLQKSCEQINMVRARVGLPKIETSNPQLNLTTNKENLIKELIRERACELGHEDTRFFDMIRRKLVEDFTKPLHGIRILRKDGKDEPQGEGDYPELKYEKYPISEYKRAWWEPGFWSNKWFLSAFPRNEINKDHGLTQNPGW